MQFITTPIYYINAVPHIGTAYTTILADVYARYCAQHGKSFLSTGTDEHGQKIEDIAKTQKQEPKTYADQVSYEFKYAWGKLNIKNDIFTRTTDDTHKAFVTKVWNILVENGDIYKGFYEGNYCVGCESFKNKRELGSHLTKIGLENHCLIHKTEVSKIKEETYLFKLSKYKDKLIDFYAKNKNIIHPHSKYNEVIEFIAQDISDISISRINTKWGIPVPNDPEHTIYVWFDALLSYYSTINNNKDLVSNISSISHFIGKDILRFHAVYLPAILIAAGYPKLPSAIVCNGFLTVDGEKISKSANNAIDPLKIVDKYGNDVLRYFLLRNISFGQDGDFSIERLESIYNAELASNLGNLISRFIGVIVKYNDGIITFGNYKQLSTLETDLNEKFEKLYEEYRYHFANYELSKATEIIPQFSSEINKYIDQAAPWKNKDRLNVIGEFIWNALDTLTTLTESILPEKTKEIREALFIKQADPKEIKLLPIKPIFPFINKS